MKKIKEGQNVKNTEEGLFACVHLSDCLIAKSASLLMVAKFRSLKGI